METRGDQKKHQKMGTNSLDPEAQKRHESSWRQNGRRSEELTALHREWEGHIRDIQYEKYYKSRLDLKETHCSTEAIIELVSATIKTVEEKEDRRKWSSRYTQSRKLPKPENS